MGRKHYKVEEIIHKLREAEVFIAKGKSVVEASFGSLDASNLSESVVQLGG